MSQPKFRKHSRRLGRALIWFALAGVALKWSWNLWGADLFGLPEIKYVHALAFAVTLAALGWVWRGTTDDVRPPCLRRMEGGD